MIKVINTERLPIKLWLDNIEQEAEQQAKNLANLPFAFKHIAIMPDSHPGYGMPIGGVLATRGYVIPNAVGVDIGCGMIAVGTGIDLTVFNKEEFTAMFKDIMEDIRKGIPVGFNHHEKEQDENLMPTLWEVTKEIVTKEYNSALHQLGTLGGGNHFIELQKDNSNYLWIMIHSGSRNLGKKVADHYNKLAIKLNDKWKSEVPKSAQLAFLPTDSEEGQSYLKEMQYCVDFAFSNRTLMMERIKDILIHKLNAKFSQPIHVAHNYAKMENHFGENVLVHRKGATLASFNTTGIIPGSQGTKSYIVKGLGNTQSFNSCSHGAGRRMSRSEAKRSLNLEEEIKKMNDLGIIHGLRNIEDLDEASSAYKDIDEVMDNQKDLVEILIELTPLAVIKG